MVSYGRSCTAELVGTFLLVLTVGCNVLGETGVWAGVSIASVLMVSIYALNKASGANFNPAVSISLGLAKKMDDGWKQVCAYCVAQIVGAALAALVITTVFGKSMRVIPTEKLEVGAYLCEIIYTFMLCFVVLNTAARKPDKDREQSQFFGMAIGFVIIAGGYASAPLGAGYFNPAVALGVLFSSFDGVGWCATYILAQVLGAGLAVAAFWAVRPEEATEQKATAQPTAASKLLSEFIGTFILTFTVGLIVLGKSPGGAFSIAASLTCMIYAIGDVSGGHFNPAVTVAIALSGKGNQSAGEAAKYIGSQLGGAVLAGFMYVFAYQGKTFGLGPTEGHGWVHVAILEILFTFVLTTAVLSVAIKDEVDLARKERPDLGQYVGFIVGACVVAGGFAAGPMGSGCLNPGVAVGIGASHIISGGLFWKALVYSLFELLGAAGAAGVFKVLYGNRETDKLLPVKAAN
eukprot:TRINITY_DN49795_c0_g1_i1.p1 TRINITY_DN49795_c0_g1~~TRINITY_DN49795_c0_g1_i1.p1  ORF type:complete len:462 (+),score=57.53 TRINITY_DN49795_c0_g1_i1:96-1481(+)